MLKVGDKVRIVDNTPSMQGEWPHFHSFELGEIVTVVEQYTGHPFYDCENDKGKRQWLLPQHYELLMETDHEEV